MDWRQRMGRLVARIGADIGFRARIVVGILIAAMALSAGSTRLAGDRVQIALPLLALGCEAVNGRAAEFLTRFVILEAGIHLPKTVLGDVPVAMRPDGGDAGMPSGHTAAAVFGATYLMDRCVLANPVARGATLLAAGFVGGSRIEAGKHDLWQVMAGALLGWLVQRLTLRSLRSLRLLPRRLRVSY